MWSCISGFFHLACFQGLSTLQHVSELSSFYCQIMFHCVYHILFIRSSVDGHLGCFYFLPVMNNTAVNIHVFMWTYVFISLGYIPTSEKHI